MRYISFDDETKKALKELFGKEVLATRIERSGLGERICDVELNCGNSTTITFAMLKKLSEIFGTDKIDVNNEIYRGGGCETCAYEEIEAKIQIYEPSRNVPL